jgi:hypothetical protein
VKCNTGGFHEHAAAAVIPIYALLLSTTLVHASGARGYVLVQLTNITGGTEHSPGARYAAAMAAVSDTETLLMGGVKKTGTGGGQA